MVKLVASESIRISIISYDTDVFILLVDSCVQELLNYELLMSGTSSGRSVIDIKATSENHRALLRSVHPVHIPSRCDTVSQIYGIGKGKASEDDRKLELENLTNSYIPIEQVVGEA